MPWYIFFFLFFFRSTTLRNFSIPMIRESVIKIGSKIGYSRFKHALLIIFRFVPSYLFFFQSATLMTHESLIKIRSKIGYSVGIEDRRRLNSIIRLVNNFSSCLCIFSSFFLSFDQQLYEIFRYR